MLSKFLEQIYYVTYKITRIELQNSQYQKSVMINNIDLFCFNTLITIMKKLIWDSFDTCYLSIYYKTVFNTVITVELIFILYKLMGIISEFFLPLTMIYSALDSSDLFRV